MCLQRSQNDNEHIENFDKQTYAPTRNHPVAECFNTAICGVNLLSSAISVLSARSALSSSTRLGGHPARPNKNGTGGEAVRRLVIRARTRSGRVVGKNTEPKLDEVGSVQSY